MDKRISANELLTTLAAWDELISGRGKIHLIACGGTALTLLGYKPSTRDVDFIVPEQKEYKRLVEFLSSAGYEQARGSGWQRPGEPIIFDLFSGSKVYMTGLLNSPLEEGKNKKYKEWKKIYLGTLNAPDLIISKMFRGEEVDIQDSLTLMQNENIDLEALKKRYKETADYDNNPERVLGHLDTLIKRWEGLSHEERR